MVAQQILTIQKAKREGAKRFVFESATLPLKQTCNLFVTMNPGYAGRSELPDNLKALFRPCAMMVPDYAMIAEISLFSEGFSTAREMSRKVVKVLQLASEQLSSQDHYDYGMRAVKAILIAAGSLKRRLTWTEDAVVLRAIFDANLPKFTPSDVELFKGIASDLFPSTVLPNDSNGEIDNAVIEVCSRNNIQPTPAFVGKVMQLHATLGVRHGLMLVGSTMSGKSTVLKTLASAMTSASIETRVKLDVLRQEQAAAAAKVCTG